MSSKNSIKFVKIIFTSVVDNFVKNIGRSDPYCINFEIKTVLSTICDNLNFSKLCFDFQICICTKAKTN